MNPRRAFFLAAWLWAPWAYGQPVRPLATSAVEHALGASAVHSVAGHGRLTAGITRDGDIAVLTWPSPSCCDQLTHLSSNAPDARSLPRTGVREGFGVALGLVVEGPEGLRTSWFHDGGQWAAAPSYVHPQGLSPRVLLTHRTLGLRVDLRDTVLPETDVLQRSVVVTREPTSPARRVWLMTHMNLGLTQNVVPRLPFGDVLLDSRNDFGLVWDARAEVLVGFRPETAGRVSDLIGLLSPAAMSGGHFGELDGLMRTTEDLRSRVNALATDLDARFGPGVYAVAGTFPAADQAQVGMEGGGFCDELGAMVNNVLALRDAMIPLGIDPGVAASFRCPEAVLPASVARARRWTRSAPSAWDDAQDGALSGNPVAAYLSDGAMRTPLSFDVAGHSDTRVLLSFGRTAAEARRAYALGAELTAGEFARRDHDRWLARLQGLSLPESFARAWALSPEAERRVLTAARRAILHMYNGTDARTGAIVASIARQAPYGLDWPRDGAFFDYALDVAGDTRATSRRLAWALPLARTEALLPGDINAFIDPPPPIDPRTGTRQYPEAAWEMNYYSDGTMGGFYRFEIDNTAWMIWSAAVHVGFAPEAEREALAMAYWEPVRRSAEMLTGWRDPATGLNALANEDDNPGFTSSLHGGTAVFAALEASARLARYLGHTMEAARWERRAAELRDVLVARFYDPARQRFINTVEGSAASNPGSAGLGPTAWLVWPARLLPYSDPRMARQVRFDLEEVLRVLRGAPGTEGGAYLTKTMLSAAVFVARGGDAEVRALLGEALDRMARDVIDADTQVMGEVFVTLRNPDGTVLRRENRVSIPHLWEGALFYLTAMAMSHPERFAPELDALPPNETPSPGTVGFQPPPDAGMAVVIDAGAVPMDAQLASPRRESSDCGCRDGRGGQSGLWCSCALAVAWALRRRREITTSGRG